LKLTADEKKFVRIRKNRDKALFNAVEDQCNDFVGLVMMALAYLGHYTSNTATSRHFEYHYVRNNNGSEQQWFYDAERGVKKNMPSLLEEEVY
jgi:hypothetical protein